ncbi:MAG: hypothetical protein HQK54_17140, partial [Oligoflexales bacterium]|nr:hypothetical protein [Oligoflexales bacterium]
MMILLKEKFLKIFIVLISYTGFSSGFAETSSMVEKAGEILSPIILNDENEKYFIGTFVQYIEDKEGLLTLDDVAAGKTENMWKNSKWEVPNFGFSSSVFWFRFQVDNRMSRTRDLLLEIGYPLHNDLEFYKIEPSGLVSIAKAGNLKPFNERSFINANFVFPLNITHGESGVYLLRSRTNTSNQYPFTVWTAGKFAQEKTSEYGGLFLYYGIVIVMIFYNLFLSVSLGNINYLYYVLYITFHGIFQSSLNGLAFQYLWPDYPVFAGKCISFSLGATIFWLTLFSLNFLDIRARSRKFYFSSMISMIWAILIMSLAFIVSYKITIKMSAALTIFALSFLTVMGVWSLKKRYKPARFYVAAFIMFFLGGILAASRMFGILPSNFFTIYGALMGSAIEIVLLSIALGDKIRAEQIEAQNKIEKLNTNLNELNLNLENKVVERTKDIRDILEFIELGIFAINRDRLVDTEYSAHMRHIFGDREFAGMSPIDLLFKSSKDSGEAKKRLEIALDFMLGEEDFNFLGNRNNLVHEMVLVTENNKERVVSIDWSAVIRNGTVEKILVSVKDISDMVRIQVREMQQREELIFVSEILNVSESRYAEFMTGTYETLDYNDRLLEDKGESNEQIPKIAEVIIVNIHTIKGSAHLIGFKKMTKIIHLVEEFLSDIKFQEKPYTR